MMPANNQQPPRYWAALLFLLLAAPIQLVGTLLAMVLFPDATWAKVGFGVAKVLLMLAPIIWLIAVERSRPTIPPWKNFLGGKGMLAAHSIGAALAVIIAVVYHTVGRTNIDIAAFREKIAQMGLGNVWLYLAGALYWCTINSLLEEYFWRWFIFSRLRDVLPGSKFGSALAVLLCGVLFTAHHVVALLVYFIWPVAIAASLGVFIGGVIWSFLYLKFRNIYVSYVCHVYADLIIFYLGYEMIFGA